MSRPIFTIILMVLAIFGSIPNAGPGLESALNMDRSSISSMINTHGISYFIQTYPQAGRRLMIAFLGVFFACSLLFTAREASTIGKAAHVACLFFLTCIMAINFFALDFAFEGPMLGVAQALALFIGWYLTYASFIDYKNDAYEQ